MPLIALLVWVAIIGLVVWLLVTYVPMPPPFKTLLIVLAVLVVALWILSSLGIGLGPVLPLRR